MVKRDIEKLKVKVEEEIFKIVLSLFRQKKIKIK